MAWFKGTGGQRFEGVGVWEQFYRQQGLEEIPPPAAPEPEHDDAPQHTTKPHNRKKKDS